MRFIVACMLVLCLAAVGCSDDDTPSDAGVDAVAEASVDAAPAETAPAETGTPEGGTLEASVEAGPQDDAAADQGGDQ